jgi:farnesol dehydrogenase
MTVLVTGGTGYLGSAIVRALGREGHDVVVFARRASASGLPGRLVDGDVRDRKAVAEAARGAHAIVHTAALVSIWRRRREEFDEINVEGLRTIIDVAGDVGVSRIVYTSSFLALPPADRNTAIHANDYQRTKAAAREVARAAAGRGVPIVSMFPGVVYGPGPGTEGNLVGRLLRDHLAGRLPGIVGADRPWSFAFVDDVAAAHVAALGRGQAGDEFALGGENVPQMRLFELLREARGTPLPRRIPYALATAIGWAEELRASLTGNPPLLTRDTVDIFRHDWSLDSRLAAQVLGYTPRPLAEGLHATLEFRAENGGRP